MRSFSTTCLNRNKPSALAERFEQILNEKVGHSTKSFIEQDPTLQHLYDKYHQDSKKVATFEDAQLQANAEQKAFEKKFQKQLAYVKSEHLLRSKEDKIIASGHWEGSERVQDTALRVLIDSAPKVKKIKRSKSLITPPKPFSVRVSAAKEGSLDYKLSKAMSPEDKEKEEFKEMYKEKLLGPAMFTDYTSSNTAVGLIGNMASARINAVINRKTGKFESPNMDKVRGKPLDRERLANSTDSNYFMNQILKNQECLPVWIENQQGIDREIILFRVELRKKFLKALIDCASKTGKHTKEEIHQYLIKSDPQALLEKASKQLMKQDGRYIKAKIEDLNRGVRNYNLQCPSTGLHKWKLTQPNEVKHLFKETMGSLELLLEDYFKVIEPPNKHIVKSGSTFLGLFESSGQGSGGNSLRGEDTLGFWKSVREIFNNQSRQI